MLLWYGKYVNVFVIEDYRIEVLSFKQIGYHTVTKNIRKRTHFSSLNPVGVNL